MKLLVKVQLNVSISKLMGTAKGYCVDTVVFDEEMIRKYLKYQEVNEKQLEIYFD